MCLCLFNTTLYWCLALNIFTFSPGLYRSVDLYFFYNLFVLVCKIWFHCIIRFTQPQFWEILVFHVCNALVKSSTFRGLCHILTKLYKTRLLLRDDNIFAKHLPHELIQQLDLRLYRPQVLNWPLPLLCNFLVVDWNLFRFFPWAWFSGSRAIWKRFFADGVPRDVVLRAGDCHVHLEVGLF